MIIKDLKRKLGQEIFNYLNAKILNLPEYKFNINDIENTGIVFLNNEPMVSKYYFDDEKYNRVNYDIYYFANKANHKIQLDNLDNILIELKNIKSVIIDTEIYEFPIIYINGKPFQSSNWTVCTLDGFEDAFQVYKINLEIVCVKK